MTSPEKPARSAGTGSSGFTLLELLVAMSLFLVLSTALIAMLTRSIGFLERGGAGTEAVDKATDFFRPFENDLQNVVVARRLEPGVPEVRFHSDYIPVDADLDGEVDTLAQRLVFVRSTVEEIADPLLREAGRKVGAEAYVDGIEDVEQAEKGDLRPPGGLMEVLYVALPDDPANPGLLTLYRAVRTPVGGKGSLFDLRNPETVKRVADPLLTDVLHFGVRFWTADTTSWDATRGGLSGGPAVSWDSTRGILPPGVGPNEFPFARGPESLDDPRDDVSPRRVRVDFVYDLTANRASTGSVAAPVTADDREIPANGTAFTATSEIEAVKVGTEWIRYVRATSEGFKGVARGVFHTVPTPHEAGESIRAGHAVSRTLAIPAYREELVFR